MRIGVPRRSGIYLTSPPKQEVLTTNLLPIENWPATLSVAPAAIRDYADGWRRIAEVPGHAAGWIWHGGMIVSFGYLSDSPLSELCDGPAEQHDTAEWADSDDPDVTAAMARMLRARSMRGQRGLTLDLGQLSRGRSRPRPGSRSRR
jgi:hypothetical protein